MSPVRRLDHIAIIVRNTQSALAFFLDKLGLEVVRTEEAAAARVRLTYLTLGNSFLQLIEPLDADAPMGRYLESHGEGVHHIGFAVDDVVEEVAALAPGLDYTLGSGRGRRAIFLPGDVPHDLRVEFVDFDFEEDVAESEGWLPGR